MSPVKAFIVKCDNQKSVTSGQADSYYVRHKTEMHENQRFFSIRMEFANNAYAYMLKALSCSKPTSVSSVSSIAYDESL